MTNRNRITKSVRLRYDELAPLVKKGMRFCPKCLVFVEGLHCTLCGGATLGAQIAVRQGFVRVDYPS